jgi:hypothetical protein
MKSAYELAMSRLEKESPSKPITDEQRRALAEIDSEIEAKIAERKVFLEGEIAKSLGDPDTERSLRRQLADEIARLEEKRESRKNAVRNA